MAKTSSGGFSTDSRATRTYTEIEKQKYLRATQNIFSTWASNSQKGQPDPKQFFDCPKRNLS
jgi:hypothetical protein